MSILKFQRFLEANINLPELDKDRNGEIRGNVLVNKLKNKEPLTDSDNIDHIINKMEDGDGQWIEVEDAIDDITDSSGKYDPEKAKKYFKRKNKYFPVFQDEEGDEFRLDQFKKTREFGSSGAGVLTQSSESIQAIFMAIKQAFPDERLTKDNLVSFYKEFCRLNSRNLIGIPEKIQIDDKLIQNFLSDKDWISTFCAIPNKIWEDDSYIDRNKLYVIYQIGYAKNDKNSVVGIIQSKFSKFSKDEGFSDINFAKWCPGDIFLASYTDLMDKKDGILPKIIATKTINELTDVCDFLFDEKVLIPLSLKKIKTGKNLVLITNKEKGKDLPTFRINGFSIGNDMKGIGSKISTGAIWKYREKKIKPESRERNLNLDSSNTSKKQNIDGEVEGSTSRHGKISLKAMTRILNSFRNIVNFETPTMTGELQKLSISKLESKVKSLIKEIEIHPRFVEAKPSRGTDIEGNEGRLISRIQSLQIVLALLKIKEVSSRDANIAMTKIMRYALSIQTDKFETPRYLRLL